MKAFICLIMCVSLGISVASEETRSFSPEPLSGTLTISGTGDSQSVLREVAKAFEKTHPNVTVKVPDSIGSSGGIKALIAGKTDLARVARALKSKEIEKYPTMIYHHFAWSPVVCVVHESVLDINSLSFKQIVDIYSGSTTDWLQLGSEQGKIYPIAREEGDSSFKEIRKHIPGFSDIQNMRAKVIFTTPETVQTLIGHQGTIGFLPLPEAKKTSLRILKLNGIEATTQTIKDKTYPLLLPFGLVSKGKPAGLNKAFLDYLYSDEGSVLLLKYGVFPVGHERPVKEESLVTSSD